jgi:Rrf2 family protein
MIYSRSSEYAIRASIHLAQAPDGKCVMAKDIARDEEIPAHFLAKILQQLARKGFLKSVKGPSGGFCLKLKAENLRLVDIVDAVDGLDRYRECIAGYPECADRTACPLHDGWIVLRSRMMDYLETNTVGSLLKDWEAKHRAARVARARRRKKTGES